MSLPFSRHGMCNARLWAYISSVNRSHNHNLCFYEIQTAKFSIIVISIEPPLPFSCRRSPWNVCMSPRNRVRNVRMKWMNNSVVKWCPAVGDRYVYLYMRRYSGGPSVKLRKSRDRCKIVCGGVNWTRSIFSCYTQGLRHSDGRVKDCAIALNRLLWIGLGYIRCCLYGVANLFIYFKFVHIIKDTSTNYPHLKLPALYAFQHIPTGQAKYY